MSPSFLYFASTALLNSPFLLTWKACSTLKYWLPSLLVKGLGAKLLKFLLSSVLQKTFIGPFSLSGFASTGIRLKGSRVSSLSASNLSLSSNFFVNWFIVSLLNLGINLKVGFLPSCLINSVTLSATPIFALPCSSCIFGNSSSGNLSEAYLGLPSPRPAASDSMLYKPVSSIQSLGFASCIACKSLRIEPNVTSPCVMDWYPPLVSLVSNALTLS